MVTSIVPSIWQTTVSISLSPLRFRLGHDIWALMNHGLVFSKRRGTHYPALYCAKIHNDAYEGCPMSPLLLCLDRCADKWFRGWWSKDVPAKMCLGEVPSHYEPRYSWIPSIRGRSSSTSLVTWKSFHAFRIYAAVLYHKFEMTNAYRNEKARYRVERCRA